MIINPYGNPPMVHFFKQIKDEGIDLHKAQSMTYGSIPEIGALQQWRITRSIQSGGADGPARGHIKNPFPTLGF